MDNHKTITIIIVIAAILYIMYTHNNAVGSSSGNSLMGFLSNPLGVGGGGGTSLGGIGHNYASEPVSGLGSPGSGVGVSLPPAFHNNIIRVTMDSPTAAPAPVPSAPKPTVPQVFAASGNSAAQSIASLFGVRSTL